MTTQAARLAASSLNALLPVARLVSVPKPYDGRFGIGPTGKHIASSVRTSCGVTLDACVRISFDVAQAVSGPRAAPLLSTKRSGNLRTKERIARKAATCPA
jgi:hypothetical protein